MSPVRFQGSKNLDAAPIRLYLDDLERIEAILVKAEEGIEKYWREPHWKVNGSTYEVDAISDLDEVPMKIDELTWRGRLTLRLGQYAAEVSADTNDLEAVGAMHLVGDELRACRRRIAYFASRVPFYIIGSIVLAPSAAFAFAEGTTRTERSLGLAGVTLAFGLWLCAVLKLGAWKTRIVKGRRTDATWLQRNRDGLIVTIAGTVVGGGIIAAILAALD